MDKLSYSLGVYMAKTLCEEMGAKKDDVKIEDFEKGIEDYLTGKDGEILMGEIADLVVGYFTRIVEQKVTDALKSGSEYLEHNAKNPDVKVLPSGVQIKVLKEGTGKSPTKYDTVLCHYEGKFVDGKVFDSSYQRGEPTTFGLGQVIQGWTIALQEMKEGSVCEITIPYELAYGESGIRGVIPGYSTLIFKVELLEVK